VGFVPAENLVGKAQIILLSLEAGRQHVEPWSPGSRTIQPSRFFNILRLMANSMDRGAMAELERRIGHGSRSRLLDRALTHASVGEGVAPQTSKAPRDNERMEFLGDRVLGLLVADRLHADFPEADEGQLSSRLHTLVNYHACGRVGAPLRPARRHAPVAGRDQGRAPAVKEGVIADACRGPDRRPLSGRRPGRWRAPSFERFWAEDWPVRPNAPREQPQVPLQEWSQGQGRPLPTYEMVGRSGSAHAPTFTVEVSGARGPPISASGRSRQDAEKAAAPMMQRERHLTENSQIPNPRRLRRHHRRAQCGQVDPGQPAGGSKVSIVTQKVQTTRFPVRGIAIQGDAQIVLVDTPGIFTAAPPSGPGHGSPRPGAGRRTPTWSST
jgi:ribonuclease-3